MYAWPWIGIELNWQLERTERENNWSSLTGRVVAICNRKFTMNTSAGVLAQLVERLNGIEEVRGSNPLGSTLKKWSRSLTQRVTLLDALAGA